jgi:hypothetical protein
MAIFLFVGLCRLVESLLNKVKLVLPQSEIALLFYLSLRSAWLILGEWSPLKLTNK